MKSIILIAVRMKSTRLPKKALADIEGKTVIERIIDRMKLAKRPDSIVLCTSTNPDDDVLVEIAKKNGVKSFRGSEADVLKRFIDAADQENADIIVRVTGDNPLTDPEHVDKMIDHHIETGADYTYIEGLPEGTKPEIMSVSALKRCRDMSENPELSEYMTLYFRDSGNFKASRMEAGPDLNRPDYRVTIDTENDLALVREIYRRLLSGERLFGLKQVIELLDSSEELRKMNSDVKARNVRMEIVDGKMKIIEVS